MSERATDAGKHALEQGASNLPQEEAESAILRAVRSIRFGSVEVTVHDSRVVQVESKKRIRFQI